MAFEILAVVKVKMTVFWGLVNKYSGPSVIPILGWFR
jgi:hypothetical protein